MDIGDFDWLGQAEHQGAFEDGTSSIFSLSTKDHGAIIESRAQRGGNKVSQTIPTSRIRREEAYLISKSAALVALPVFVRKLGISRWTDDKDEEWSGGVVFIFSKSKRKGSILYP